MSIYTVFVSFDDREQRKHEAYVTAAETDEGAIKSAETHWRGLMHYYHPKAQNVEYVAKHVMDLPHRIKRASI
jgi:hypothetical protein